MKKLSLLGSSLPPDFPAIITHVVLGFPSLEKSLELIQVMSDSGAAAIEVQIPFSDPIADGPTIMQANELALANGVTPEKCLEALAKISSEVQAPLVAMSYFNIVFNYGWAHSDRAQGYSGVEKFIAQAKQAGLQGIITADLPPEENSEDYWTLCNRHQISPIPIVSPLTSVDRMKKIAAACAGTPPGFVYCVSTTGTTGARSELPPEIASYLARVSQVFTMPRAVGFGISSREQILALTGKAELAIVGSAMLDRVSREAPGKQLQAARDFLRELMPTSC